MNRDKRKQKLAKKVKDLTTTALKRSVSISIKQDKADNRNLRDAHSDISIRHATVARGVRIMKKYDAKPNVINFQQGLEYGLRYAKVVTSPKQQRGKVIRSRKK